ncbi:MAG: 30S ribosomal protein S3 [Tepidiforma sp.]|jgi:small subunit ribosomal protein S3|uniref:Small ribosomal subunit protein uS3 n=1 Tax=Tepidiforma bonchosmolovskayae TaxID=2601677 RepID=A0ABX6C2J2_9CHLR|nr:30S ribosomal protein S3 [Tepidiforma bonchosmolovskayae]GIW16405.1 MAG: 30S ribosomal protein S3 [Tepidiforma sp.]
MGQKVHPHGFRLGILYDWESKWFADRDYTQKLHQDIDLRNFVLRELRDAAISRIEIDRNANLTTITIHTAKPGIVIGRGGAKVEELRNTLERYTGGRVRVNIQEIRVPELDAYLVARSVADQLERRVAFRRAIKQAVQRTMQRGARGCRITISGRLGGAEMSRRETETQGRVPRHTLRADIDYGLAEALTTFGTIGVKVWIYKGDVLPQRAERAAEEPAPEPALVAPRAAEPDGPAHTAISMEQQAAVRESTEGAH